MLATKTKECITKTEIDSTYLVMRQLRPRLDEATYFEQIDCLIKTECYRMFAVYDELDRCIGVIGFQILNRLSLGKILYIADLVVDEKFRSLKIGEQLLEIAKAIAKNVNADAIVLESGAQRKRAHQFYFNNGYDMESYSFRLYKPFTHDSKKY